MTFARLGVLLMLAWSAAASAEVYRWTDAQGRVHFGDRPPAGAATTEVEVHLNTYDSPSVEALEKALYGNGQVIIYTAEWCPICKQAKAYFRKHHIRFTEYDVEKSARGRRDYKTLGAQAVPVILIGKQRLNGFSEEKFHKLYAADEKQ